MSTIVADHVGPIVHLELPIREGDGGIAVIKGPSGSGKSTFLRGLSRLIGCDDEVEAHDEAPKGTLEGLGRKMTVGRTTRITGDLECAVLGDRFSLDALVNPRGETSEVREARRIRELVRLGGKKADPAMFYSLVGSREAFESVVPADKLKTDDLVDLSVRIKRALDEAARVAEGQRDHARRNADAARLAAQDIDVSLPCDATALQNALIEAAGRVSALKQQRTARSEAEERGAVALRKLEEHERTAPNVADAQAEVEQKKKARTEARDLVDELTEKLQDAKEAFEKAEAEKLAAERLLDSAKRASDAAEGWRLQIESLSGLPNPPESEIVAAEQAAAAAREAVETGNSVRFAKEKLALAVQFDEQVKQHEARGDTLRKAAQAVEGVLSSQIPEGPLFVRAGRLCLVTDRSKAEPFEDLSDGERVKIAAPYVVNAIAAQVPEGASGVHPLPQRAWQDLQPDDKDALAELCKSKRVWFVTAEVSRGELRAEEYRTAS